MTAKELIEQLSKVTQEKQIVGERSFVSTGLGNGKRTDLQVADRV